MRRCPDFGNFPAKIVETTGNLDLTHSLRFPELLAPDGCVTTTTLRRRQTRPVSGGGVRPAQATSGSLRSYWYVEITDTRSSPHAAAAVTELYAGHALGLVRLAVLLVGDRASAEDIVQDAFLGLYRRRDRLPDTSAPLGYLRVSVLNGCRSRYGDCRNGSARRWCSATTSTCRKRRSPRPWASAAAPSSPRPPARARRRRPDSQGGS
jgi:sigma-70-like protein